MKNNKLNFIFHLITLFIFTFYYSAGFYISVVHAEDMPSKDQLSTSISNQATSQTSNINADTSSAPSNTSNTDVSNTGDNTSTSSNNQNNSQTGVENQNSAEINQTTEAAANTGNNEASRNISIGGDAGIINTGNATVNTNTEANANSNNTSVAGGNGSTSTGTQVANTGDGVSVSNDSSSNSTTYVANGNTTTINQAVNATANTGGNKADRNISIGGQAGVITTGDAAINTSFLVTANGNVTLIGGNGSNGGPGSGASIYITNTGNNSQFSSSSSSNHYIVVTNTNRALISQMCGSAIPDNQLVVSSNDCFANTGYNVSDRNIGQGSDAGVIQTGDAELNVSQTAVANSNKNTVNQPNGQANTNTSVINTGNNADISVNSSTNQNTQVENNNQANIYQTVYATANTGYNRANRNISFGGNAGVINTGNATVNVDTRAYANKNDTKIVNSGSGNANNGGQHSLISNTGNDFSYKSNQVNNSKTTVTNNNFLTVVQNFIANASTGFNSAIKNIGTLAAGIINTGNATVDINAKVSANTNKTIIDVNQSNNPVTTPTPIITPPLAETSPTPTPDDEEEVAGASSQSPQSAASTSAQNNVDDGEVLGASSLPASGSPVGILASFFVLFSYGLGLKSYKPKNIKSKLKINNSVKGGDIYEYQKNNTISN